MLHLLVVLLALITLTRAGPIEPIEIQKNNVTHPPNEFIVGGKSVPIINFPYQLSLRLNDVHLCGAAIISIFWAITAAHCVFQKETTSLSLQAGSTNRISGGTIYQIFISVVHPEYNPVTVDYDFALLLMKSPIWFGPTISAIALPLTDNYVADGTKSVVSGWGALTETNSAEPIGLKAVTVLVIENSICNTFYSGRITDRMMCAGYFEGGKDACRGDSGTPLVVNGILVGIASWGSGCGRENAPGVYSRIGSVRYWIYNVARV